MNIVNIQEEQSLVGMTDREWALDDARRYTAAMRKEQDPERRAELTGNSISIFQVYLSKLREGLR